MPRTLVKSIALGFCLISLHGCFDSSEKNKNDGADKSKASVQMQNKDADNK